MWKLQQTNSYRYFLIGFLVVYILQLPASTVTNAQNSDYFLGTNRYSFIDYPKNQFAFVDSLKSFSDLYNDLDTVLLRGEGKIQIVHLGGSHIQADIYTHQIRKRFQQMDMAMNGGRGLVFPARVAKTNNPSNFSVTYSGNWLASKSTKNPLATPLGLTGMAVSTTDSIATISINPNEDSTLHYNFVSIRIFHNLSNYSISLETTDSTYKGYYDSVQACTIIPLAKEYTNARFIFTRNAQNEKFSLLGISFDSDEAGVVYNAMGVNGAMLSSYLNCSLYKSEMAAINPQLVIFSIGTNDAYTRNFDREKFKKQYQQLLDSTLTALPRAAILITVPNDSYLYRKYVNHNTAEMEKVIYELAEIYKCGVWDFYSVMGGLNSSQSWYNMRLMQYDRVHFTREGYLLKGDLFFSAFLKGWEMHLAKKEVKAEPVENSGIFTSENFQ